MEKLKTYNEITDYVSIARRYFVNNFYDGMLTILGILLGFFVILLKDPSHPTIDSNFVILTGLGTSISMLISGMSGSYLSEKAEQKKGKKELDAAMGYLSVVPEDQYSKEEIEKAMVIPIKNNNIAIKKKNRPQKTIHEKAEAFTGVVVSFVNGFSPFLGGIVPIIPFFLIKQATVMTFVTSFAIILVCIVFLGIFLGKISQESKIKNVLQMAFAFTLTIIITILFLG